MTADPPSSRRSTEDVVADLHREQALTLVRTANLLLRDRQAAEDAVQDAFISLYQAMPRLRDHDRILPYLRTAVINNARSALRSQRTRPFPVLHELPGGSAEATVLDRADRAAVLAAVSQLPQRSREVLVLRYYLDLSDPEIAATLGVSRSTVTSTASRALAALSRQLKEES